ncbi:SAM-dependent methyltransferase [Fodinicola feengrottensis]|uniref:SAM-dependent methyltransferase n=1 Tax=Fodinicola feengrottensis TaxID=435914 RepID=UPI0024432BE5|nr:SAM-dependent methyltransferase [Fodinicola feengrottensis]
MSEATDMSGIRQPDDIDHAAPVAAASRPSDARVYDYALGGKDNFEIDRQVFHRVSAIAPQIAEAAMANRKWLLRACRWLARDVGMDQFLDCGSGLPTTENVHEVVQEVNPEASVVYIDRDAVVVAHGRALLEENDRTHFIQADLSMAEKVLADPVVSRNLDFDRPIVMLQCLTLQGISDLAVARHVMETYVAALPVGSYVIVTHPYNPTTAASKECGRGRSRRPRGRSSPGCGSGTGKRSCRCWVG